MLITLSFKKSLIVELFRGNYLKITRKEVFGLNIIQENHEVNAVLSQDSKLRRKKKTYTEEFV